jgi:hypothetical protein
MAVIELLAVDEVVGPMDSFVKNPSIKKYSFKNNCHL